MSQPPSVPDFKAKQNVFVEILGLMATNRLSVADVQAFVDAMHVMEQYVKLRKAGHHDASMNKLFDASALEIAQILGSNYVEMRVMLMGFALDSLTR